MERGTKKKGGDMFTLSHGVWFHKNRETKK